MLAQFPQSTKARFAALQYRANPITVSPARQSRAAALAPTVKAIKPGIYLVGGKYYISLWENACSCREHRIGKIRPCRHQLALWLAEGINLDDPDPALYLKSAGVEQPEIIAIYAQFEGNPRQYRIVNTGTTDGDGKKWFAAYDLIGESSRLCQADELFFVTPFYE